MHNWFNAQMQIYSPLLCSPSSLSLLPSSSEEDEDAVTSTCRWRWRMRNISSSMLTSQVQSNSHTHTQNRSQPVLEGLTGAWDWGRASHSKPITTLKLLKVPGHLSLSLSLSRSLSLSELECNQVSHSLINHISPSFLDQSSVWMSFKLSS